MSDLMNDTRSATAGAAVTLASFSQYAQAARLVDALADDDFPLQSVSVVGRGLKVVERVTGRAGYASAAGEGAGHGAFIGALFGLLLGLFNWVDPVVAAFWLMIFAALVGVIAGALAGLVIRAATRGRRDFSSVMGVEADAFDVVVDAEHADHARRVLDGYTRTG